MLTSRSRGSDITLIVDELPLSRTSSIVSVLAVLNEVPARWSEPISRIVCGAPGGRNLDRLDLIAVWIPKSLARF